MFRLLRALFVSLILLTSALTQAAPEEGGVAAAPSARPRPVAPGRSLSALKIRAATRPAPLAWRASCSPAA